MRHGHLRVLQLLFIEAQADLKLKETHLTALRVDISKGVETARRLRVQAQVTDLESSQTARTSCRNRRMSPTFSGGSGTRDAVELTLLRFTPTAQKMLPLYEVPYRITAEGSYITSASSSTA
jgi:hypothetical protein